jgi:ATP-dependent helicase/nuclease subunit A
VLGAQRGRQRILARLGNEAADALDEFLNLAIDYERRETPSLQGFVAWLRAAKTDVKRDMEMARDEVRVMTVHGAKGLEAPTVILADTTTRPAGPRDPSLLALPAADAPPDAPARLVWAMARKNDVEAMTSAREQARRAAQDEYRRLLYVAMTRAAERLVVCGTQGQNKIPDRCWWELVHDALCAGEPNEPADDGDGTVWRYRKAAPEQKQSAATAPPPAAVKLPHWLRQDAKADAAGPRSLAPASAYRDAFRAATGNPSDARKSLARGRLVHRLLQSLPDIPARHRAEAAHRHLARAGDEFNADDRRTIAEQVLRLLDDPRCNGLFGPGSRAEVAIVGRLASAGRPPFLVSGQLDRLAITANSVLIADYKTGRPPREGAPDSYVTQLALYRAVLARLFPARPLRAALVWTDVPDLMEISPSALDAALAQVTAACERLDGPGTRS